MDSSSSRRNKGLSRPAGGNSPESFDSIYKRNAAAEILQSYEKLSWFSFQRCETLMQTRLHFERLVAGIDEADGDDVKWKEDFTRHPKEPSNQPTSSKKGKEKVTDPVSDAGQSSSAVGTGTTGNRTGTKERRSNVGDAENDPRK